MTSDTEVFDAIVVGSGPSGMFAAKKNLDLGKKTLLVDIGYSMTELEEYIIRFSADHFKRTRNFRNLKILLDSSLFKSENKTLKSRFSLDPTQNSLQSSDLPRMKSLQSRTLGGFTEIWGAAIAKISVNQSNYWSSNFGIDLEEFYSEVLECIPSLKVKTDDLTILQSRVVNFSDSSSSVEPTTLAVYTQGERACISCQNCMRGCVTDSIFSTRHMLKKLIKLGLQYKPGVQVLKLEEIDNSFVNVTCRDLSTGKNFLLRSKKIFIGAGVVSTAKVISKSFSKVNEIIVKDSQIIYGLHFGLRVSSKRRHRSLAELSIKLADDSLYIQLYTLDRSILDTYFNTEKIYNKIIVNILYQFRYFLVISLTYLPSNLSANLNIKNDLFEINEQPCLRVTYYYYKSLFRCKKIFHKLKVSWFSIFFRRANSFVSMHFSSSFAKNTNFRENCTDREGRIGGTFNIHIVDGSVLPEVIVGPPTLTIMANSLRIVDESWSNYD
jgi:hypothetical protein